MKTLITAILVGLAVTLLISGLAIGGNAKITKADGEPSGSEQQTSEPATGEEINWQVISAGGTDGSSTNFQLSGTAGQTATGTGSSTSFGLSHGFWEDFGGGPVCVPGDADGSGAVDIDDVVYLINYIFAGGPAPTPAICCGDADGSGDIDIDDVVYLINYIFAGGPAPVDIC